MANITSDLGFISCPNAPCGLSSCNRNNPHYHCRLCGFGTSQIGNVVAHNRVCPGLEISPKDFNMQAGVSDAMYPVSTQSYSYYQQNVQTSSTKITSQQSTMFNFVHPSHNNPYAVFGQTVFPNPSLFSPSSFNNIPQLDNSWPSQSRLISAINCSPDLDKSKSSNCCRADEGGLSAESSKINSKEMHQQNWYNPPNVTKYCESSASSSCSLSLVLLEPNKDTEECVNVDDICFTPTAATKSESEESDIVVEDSESDCSQERHVTIHHCLICKTKPCSTQLQEESPVTLASQTLVSKKLSAILKYDEKVDSNICKRCLDLVNLIDSLEVKLSVAVDEIKALFEASKESEKNDIDCDMRCDICDKTFSSAAYLEKHKQYHTKSFSFYCEYCGKGFTDLRKLEKHVILHSSNGRFQCELCGKQFLEKYTLNNHIRQHKGEHRFHCHVCKKGFVQKSVFKIHVQSHTDNFFVCQHCGRQVKNYWNLESHLKICSGNLKFQCGKCQKSFASNSLLVKHVNVQHKLKFRFSCATCNKGFWKESDLVSHMGIHTSEKPFKCETCGNCYKSRKNLTHHMRLHQESKFKCKICFKNFTRSDALSDHMNGHSGIRPYECSICFKKFANRINFNVHFKKHDSNKTACKCLICHKVVYGKLEEHLKTHSDKKLFACKICSASFAFKNSLVKHLKAKHGNFNKALS